MSGHCVHCDSSLPPGKRNPKQRYCGRLECQRARKRQWQKEKLQNDPCYKENQKQANKDWQKNNPDYWQGYRSKNKGYAERNRVKSRDRMRLRRQVALAVQEFAKMDASLVDEQRLSGYYALLPFGDMFAKMDVKILKVHAPGIFPGIQQDVCKERTVLNGP